MATIMNQLRPPGFNEVKSLDEEKGIDRPTRALIKTIEGNSAPTCSTGS